MEILVIFSIVLPIIAGITISVLKSNTATLIISSLMLPLLGFAAFEIYNSNLPIFIETPEIVNFLITLFDFGLLGYFFYLGYSRKSILVMVLAILQLILLIVVLLIIDHTKTANIYVDNLTAIMYLMVALVGVPIAIFATKYMDFEEDRKHLFAGIVVGFLGVMNFIVSANNIEWFFALFETTTLASVVMIGFRGDKEALNNSTLALWMNQIGGVAILLSLIVMIKEMGVYHFSDLLSYQKDAISMAALGFLSIAALVKGAQLPFHRWLLGAMVAPTPVSAILHSATMVKVAPFLLLRISPIIHDTLLSKLLIITTGFVFVIAAVFALTQDNLKKILAYSTISLLGLMMLAAAVGTPNAIAVSIALIIFHGVAKGFLFVEAGVLEKLFKVKYIADMNRLIERAPLTLMFLFFGFLNMTFVPFGSFVAKWLMVEEASRLMTTGSYVLLIILVAVGGVFLSTLYIKVLGVAVKQHRFWQMKVAPQPKTFMFVSVWYYIMLLILAILVAPFMSEVVAPAASVIANKATDITSTGLDLHFGDSTLYFWQIFGVLLLLLIIHLAPVFMKFKNVDQVHPYNCGELTPRYAESYDFNFILKYEKLLNIMALTLFIFVLVLGGQLL